MGLNLKKFRDDVFGTASRVYDQANPFDAGLSYKTRQVNPNTAQQSTGQQFKGIFSPAPNRAAQQSMEYTNQRLASGQGFKYGPLTNAANRQALIKENQPFTQNLLSDIPSEALKSTRDVAVSVARDIPRLPVRVGLEARNLVKGGSDMEVRPTNRATELLLGKEPIKSSSREMSDFAGQYTDSTLLKNIAGVTGAALDIVPAGFGIKSAVKSGTKNLGKSAAKGVEEAIIPPESPRPIVKLARKPSEIVENTFDPINVRTDNNPSYLNKTPTTIEQKRAQQQAGIEKGLGKKVEVPAETKFKKDKALQPEKDTPAFMRQAEPLANQVIYKTALDEWDKSPLGLPDIPENISPKTKNLIESVRAKEAPPVEKGAPKPEDTSLVKGQSAKAPVTPEAEFQQAVINSKPSVTRKGNVGDYQYSKPEVALKQKLSIGQKLSPDRVIRENVTRPLVEKAQRALFDASISENPLLRGTAKLAQGITKESTAPPEILNARRKLFGASEYGKLKGADIRALSNDLPTESLQRVYATLDPEQAGKLGIDQPAALTPEETVYRDKIRAVVTERTQGLAERGIITPEQAANDNYLRRAYSVFDDAPEVKAAYDGSRKAFLSSLKGRKEEISNDLVETAITDPGYLAGKNYAEFQQAAALHDYVAKMANEGLVSDSPRPGFRQIPTSKIFGENAGKFVPEAIADDITGFQYTSGLMNSLNDILTAYDHFKPRQLKKAMLTILNPGVRTGNQLTNRLIFSQLNGINPLTYNKNMLATRGMIKSRDPVYVEALKQGLIGTDITKADFAVNLADSINDSGVKKWLNAPAKSYQAADDRARLAAFKSHLDRGYSSDEAAQLTQRGFQDYKSIGYFFDLAAKTPVVGNAFVRFAGDANRIIANAFIDHPIRTIGTGMVWANLVNMMSKVSGESEQDKQTREGRFGAPHIPFTDVSLTVQTPIGEVNLARFVPMYALNDVGGGDARRFLPFQGNPTDPRNFNDPLLGHVGQVLTDTDFRGKSIRDPANVIFDKQTYNDTQGQAGAKFSRESNPEKILGVDKDVAGFLGTQNIPLGRELNAIYSAVKGGEDIYGKERSVPQAISRAAGFKVEEFGPKQAEKQRNTNAFFEGNIARTNEFLKANPDLKSQYYKFSNPTRDRATNTKVSDLVTPERWKIVNSDKSNRLYDFLKNEATTQNKENGKPIDPVFQFDNPQRVREVLELRSRPSGDDIEREEILRATTSWYKPFEQSERDYYKANTAWYDNRPKGENPALENARPLEYRNIPHPEQPPLYQKYLNIRYGNKDEGIPANEQAGKDFFKANADTLSSLADNYKKARLEEINAKRKIEGFPPISQDTFNNVTFGYEDDERKVFNELKYGKGYGGYGSGGSGGQQSAGSIYKYAIDPEAAGSPRKPSISVKAPAKKSVKAKKRSQPKVSIKKSLV